MGAREQVRRRVASVATDRLQLVLMLALTFGTGLLDAVGYLGLDRVFVGNMTGNVVILGMGLGGGDDLPVVGPLVALAGFLVGAALGGRALRGVADPWRRTPLLLALVAGVVAAVGVALVVAPSPGEVGREGAAAALGLAMRLQAAVARRVAVTDVTTVVVTSTLTGLAADSALGGGEGGRTARRLAAVVAILLGALAGALLVRVGAGVGVLVAAGLVLVVAAVGAVHARAAAGRTTGATDFRS